MRIPRTHDIHKIHKMENTLMQDIPSILYSMMIQYKRDTN